MPTPLCTRRMALLLLLAAASCSLLGVADAGSYQEPGGNFGVTWTVDTVASTITFEMSAPTTGWLSMGVSLAQSGHSNTDIVVGWVDAANTLVLVDTYSSARAQPQPDAQANITPGTYSQDATSTTISFTRPLASLDTATDVNIDAASTLYLSWATCPTDGTAPNAYPKHNLRGTAQVDFLADAGTDTGTGGVATMGGSYASDDGKFSAEWTVADNTITMTMVGQTLGWVGVGWSLVNSGHANTDLVVGWVGQGAAAAGILVDAYSTAQAQPLPDAAASSLTLVSALEDAVAATTSITFTRPLTTLEDGTSDVNIVAGAALYLSWAIGDADGLSANSYGYHSARGTSGNSINFLATTGNPAMAPAQDNRGGLGVLPVLGIVGGVIAFAGVAVLAVRTRKRSAANNMPAFAQVAGLGNYQQPQPGAYPVSRPYQQQPGFGGAAAAGPPGNPLRVNYGGQPQQPHNNYQQQPQYQYQQPQQQKPPPQQQQQQYNYGMNEYQPQPQSQAQSGYSGPRDSQVNLLNGERASSGSSSGSDAYQDQVQRQQQQQQQLYRAPGMGMMAAAMAGGVNRQQRQQQQQYSPPAAPPTPAFPQRGRY